MTPKVMIVIAAWNEADWLTASIDNCVQQEYPPKRLAVIVISDGSTDDSEVVIRKFDPSRVRLIKLETREENNPLARLTQRERKVADLIGRGVSNREIARRPESYPYEVESISW